jgi:hypothetical protein
LDMTAASDTRQVVGDAHACWVLRIGTWFPDMARNIGGKAKLARIPST